MQKWSEVLWLVLLFLSDFNLDDSAQLIPQTL